MENIFKNAYFGKAYKTRDGKKAIYWKHGVEHHLLIETGYMLCKDDGLSFNINKPNLDIVSEWQDVIDDNNLNEIAYEELGVSKEDMEEFDACLWTSDDYIDAFKAGYRKALNK